MSTPRKYRYAFTCSWGDLSWETVEQLETSDFIIDVWKGEHAQWLIERNHKIVGGFDGVLVGPVGENA